MWQWLSSKTGKPYRLLSEAEWEYACRAGTETAYSFGESISKSQAQFSEGGRSSAAAQPLRLAPFPRMTFGLYDMHGNVWEWCEDRWHESYELSLKPVDANGRAWTTGDRQLRVLRGGSWAGHP